VNDASVNTALMSSLRPLARVAAAALDVVVSSDSTCTLPLSMEIIATLSASTPAYDASADWNVAWKAKEKVVSSNAEMSKSEKDVMDETV
jgi:hypothetical protein